MEATAAASVSPLARARFLSGRQQYLLAAEAHVHPNRWSAIENGRLAPSQAERDRIAAVFNVAVVELFPETLEGE